MSESVPAYIPLENVTADHLNKMVSANYRTRATASTGEFRDVANSISIRDGFDRYDRDWFRPGEEIPVMPKDIMAACMQAYRRIGIVRQVIDMMGEFCSKGIDLVHTNLQVQAFYQEWFKKVNGKERTERILNMMYRAGNVPIKRSHGLLTVTQTKDLRSGMVDGVESTADEKPRRKRIPWTYEIFNPLSIDIIGGDIDPLLGKRKYRYGAWINDTLIEQLKNASKGNYTAYTPQNLLEDAAYGAKTGRLYSLDPADTVMIHYKKDDWQVWADPMTYAIYKDLQALEKLKLSDLAALDGACMYVRLWKLGSIATTPVLYPSPDIVDKLAGILASNSGGGPMDLIWGPDIELVESKTDISKFLDPQKYMSTLNAVFAGLGVPPTLTGVPLSTGFTNSWTSLKTLIERLQYGRDQIVKFWENEIRLVQREMGFKEPATLVFDQQILTDEAALQKLIIDLIDRDIISEEAALDRFDFNHKIEDVRKRREGKARKNGKKPIKTSPYHSPMGEQKLKEIFAQQGTVTPSQVGLELDENDGEKTAKEIDAANAPKTAGKTSTKSKKGAAGEGRPVGAIDTQPRKPRRVLPRTAASLATATTWAKNAQKAVSEIVTPIFLKAAQKKNVRSLTQAEVDGLESLKFTLLANLEVMSEPDEKTLMGMLQTELTLPVAVKEYKDAALSSCQTPTIDDVREAQALACAVYRTELA